MSWQVHCDERYNYDDDNDDHYDHDNDYQKHCEYEHNVPIHDDEFLCYRPYLTLQGYYQCANQCEYDKQYCLVDCDGRVFTHLPKLYLMDMDKFQQSMYIFCGQCAYSAQLKSQRRNEFSYSLVDDTYYSLENLRKVISPQRGGRKLLRLLKRNKNRNFKLTQFKQQQNICRKLLKRHSGIFIHDIIDVILSYLDNNYDCIFSYFCPIFLGHIHSHVAIVTI